MNKLLTICLTALLGLTSASQAEEAGTSEAEGGIAQTRQYQACILQMVSRANGAVLVSEIRGKCSAQTKPRIDDDILASRRREEQLAITSRRALVPHKRNFLMPATYTVNPKEKPIPPALSNFAPIEDIDNIEMKFQLSLKYQFAKSVLMRDDRFHFAFTSLSFWQAYNSDASAPFRETNYEPEVFWTAPVEFQPLSMLGIDASEVAVGFSHQSNGQSGTLSRSWNRVYAKFTWESGKWVFGLKPWYRIREDEKQNVLDADGDDNPDIEKYMGHFEFRSTYRTDNHELSMMLRNNLRSENHGAVQLDWTFPIWRGLSGHAQYFNGYGESMIDYNQRVERFGLGLILSDLY